MIVDESWIGVKAKAATEGGGVLSLLAKHRHNTCPRESQPQPALSKPLLFGRN